MLYFSKLKIISVTIFTLLLSYFSLSNFIKSDDNFFQRNINLGLDLQGGSYLLLEIDNEPVIIQEVQTKFLQIKKFLKNKKVSFKNIDILNDKDITFEVYTEDLDKTKKLFDDKDSEINPYYPQYKSHQFEINIEQNIFTLIFSKHGLIQIKSSSQNLARKEPYVRQDHHLDN